MVVEVRSQRQHKGDRYIFMDIFSLPLYRFCWLSQKFTYTHHRCEDNLNLCYFCDALCKVVGIINQIHLKLKLFQ